MREEFIRSFVRELITGSYKPVAQTSELDAEKRIEPENFSSMVPSMIHEMDVQKIPHPDFQIPAYNPQLKTGQIPAQTNVGKINSILNDPAVFAVECQGAGKNVLVNRSGSILSSSIALSEEDINAVLGDFSQKTRIPLGQGVFRALYQDLLITAVISEFVGTRFVIQKKTPFQRF